MTNKDDSWQTCNMDERTNEEILCESIERLQSENAELRKERDDLIAALKKSDDEYLELEQRLAGQVSDEREVAIRNLRGSAGTFITNRIITENDRRILSRLCADFDAAESQPAATSTAAAGDVTEDRICADTAKRLRRVCMLLGLSDAIPKTDKELGGVVFSVLGMIARAIEKTAPASAGVPDEIKRAIRSAKTAMNMWENGYAFDTHGKSRDIQREIEAADAMLSTQPAADGGGE